MLEKENKIQLPYRFIPREYQIPVMSALDSGFRRACLVWHRRAGKDKTLLNYTIKCMFPDPEDSGRTPNARIGTYYHLFPTYAQGKKIIWDGIDRDGQPFLSHFPKPLVASKNETELRIETVNGSAYQIIGTDKFDSIVGPNPVGCIFSEYSLQDPRAWDLLRPILVENRGWAAFIFTPRGQNHAFQMYRTALNNPDVWFTQLLTIRDTRRHDGTPVITEEEIEQERREGMSEAVIQQDFYCDFSAVNENSLIEITSVDSATQRKYGESVYRHQPKVIGVDIARFGDDISVITTRQGYVVYPQIKIRDQHNETNALAGRIAQEIKTHKPSAVFIDAGYNPGVIDTLRNWGYTITEVNFGGKADDPLHYLNKRAEMWARMRDWLQNGSIPDDPQLRNDLISPTYDFSGRMGSMRLESKESMKERGIQSPNCGDSLALSFAYPVYERKIEDRRFEPESTGKLLHEYDPFKEVQI